jgi:hypothetical protein
MGFLHYYNWLKYSVLPPSFYFKNRLFIERNFKNKYIYSRFGFSQKSFNWSSVNTRVISTFLFSTNKIRFFLFLALLVFLFFMYVYFTHSSVTMPTSAAANFALYLLWRVSDLLYFWLINVLYLFITVLGSWTIYLLKLFAPLNFNIYTILTKHFLTTRILEIKNLNHKKSEKYFIWRDSSFLNSLQSTFRNNLEAYSTLYTNTNNDFFTFFKSFFSFYNSSNASFSRNFKSNLIKPNYSQNYLKFFLTKQELLHVDKPVGAFYIHSNINKNKSYFLEDANSNTPMLKYNLGNLFFKKFTNLMRSNRWLQSYSTAAPADYFLFNNYAKLQNLLVPSAGDRTPRTSITPDHFSPNFSIGRDLKKYKLNRLVSNHERLLQRNVILYKNIFNNLVNDFQLNSAAVSGVPAVHNPTTFSGLPQTLYYGLSLYRSALPNSNLTGLTTLNLDSLSSYSSLGISNSNNNYFLPNDRNLFYFMSVTSSKQVFNYSYYKFSLNSGPVVSLKTGFIDLISFFN